MKAYIYFALFAIGFVWTLADRIAFERQKGESDKAYPTTYRKYNTLVLLLYLALSIDKALDIVASFGH